MNLKDIFVKGLRSACQYFKRKPICEENTNQNLKTMGPAKKKTKLIPEESEIIIDIDRKGACKFKIISKVESTLEKNTIKLNKNGDTKDRLSILTNGLNEDATNLDENKKSASRMKKSSLFHTLDLSLQRSNRSTKPNGREMCHKYPPTSRYVALDCEFVGVGNDRSALGRCSIVDYNGRVVCDIYAKPLEKITTYRTKWSGITKQHMAKAIPLESALSQITDIIKDKIVVGHALRNDFLVLGFSHPTELIRDTGKSPPLARLMKQAGSQVSKQMSLKRIALTLLGRRIQNGCHCSVIDARTSMDLYKLVRDEWEESFIDDSDNKDDNDGGETSREIKSEVDKATVKSVENHVEKDNSFDKIKVIHASHDVTMPRGFDRNDQKVSFGQKRKITDSETELQEANGMTHISCVKSLTDINNTMLQSSSTDSAPSSDCSDSVKEESLSSSTCSTSKNVFSQKLHNNQLCDTVSGPKSKKRKCVDVRKSELAADYTKNVKHLFHDLFWEDLDNLFHGANCDMN